jgi:hypothetical protein
MTALLGAAVIALWATSAYAQKANFAGKWTREAPAAGAAAAGGGGGGGGQRGGGGGGGGAFTCGMACEITQDATTIKVSRMQGEATVVASFPTAGGDAKNQLPGRQGGAPTDIVSTTKWDGAKYVVTTTRDMGGTPVTSTQTISIEGGKLSITTTSSREGSAPSTITYTKG